MMKLRDPDIKKTGLKPAECAVLCAAGRERVLGDRECELAESLDAERMIRNRDQYR